MNKLTIGVLTLGSIILFACSAPPADSVAKSSNQTTKDPAEPKEPATSAGDGSKGSTTEDEADDEETDTGDDEDEDPAAEACWTQCVASNAQAQKLSTQIDGCYDACEDDACYTRCDDETEQLCSEAANAAACDALGACETKCFPAEADEAEEDEDDDD